jgi:hypothetical protein
VRTVYTCGLWQSGSLLAAAVSGAGVSSVPNTCCPRSAVLSACSNPAVVSAVSRRVRQEEMNPVDTSTPSSADIKSAVRSMPSTSWLASRVAAAVTFGP